MTTQGLLSGKTVWIVFAAYFLFLIAIARYTTWKEKRDAGRVDLQGGRFKWPVMVMTYIASCMSVWVFFAGPGAYYRYGLGYFFSEMCIYSMFPIICYFTMTKVWLVNQQKHFTPPTDFFFCRSALADDGVKAVRQCHDKVVAPCLLCSGLHLLHGGIGLSEADVIGDGVREQISPLEHEGEIADEAVVAVLPHIPSAKAHAA